jgi:hypothetical protein
MQGAVRPILLAAVLALLLGPALPASSERGSRSTPALPFHPVQDARISGQAPPHGQEPAVPRPAEPQAAGPAVPPRPPDPPAPPRPTPLPTATLEEFWERMRAFAVAPAMDALSPLPPDQRDDPLFGVNAALAMETAVAPIMHGLGAARDRLEIRWDQVEPAPGPFVIAALDRRVAEGVRWHLGIIAVVDGAPAWAVDRPERAGAGPPRGLDAPPLLPSGAPNPANPWAAFLVALARRYRGRIAAWELWNEPNFRDYWRGSAADYARLLADGSAALHSVDPGATILVGGMVEDGGLFLDAVAAQLCPAAPCPDLPLTGVAWHVYGRPTDILTLTARTHQILRARGADAEVWITEANIPFDDPLGHADALVPPGAASLDQQASFVLQAYALARAAGVRTLAIYRASDVNEDHHYWGLLRDDLSARPALLAYRTAARWLAHTRPIGLSHPADGLTRVSLRRGEMPITVLWNDLPRAAVVRLTAAAAPVRIVRADGTEQTVPAANGMITLSLPPAPSRPGGVPLAPPVIIVGAS